MGGGRRRGGGAVGSVGGVGSGVGDQARQVLLALADLAPSAQQRSGSLTVPTEWFRWLGVESLRLFAPEPFAGPSRPAYQQPGLCYADVERRFAEQLAAVDQLRPGQRSLRVGWLFVAGTMRTEDGRSRRCSIPW